MVAKSRERELELDENGYMQKCLASINDEAIEESDRRL